MAISAVDNTLWDLRGRYFKAPVYRLLGGPTRPSVEAYASCLGYSLEPDKVQTRAAQVKKEGYRHQKWFLAYGPGDGYEGMKKNVDLVRILREGVLAHQELAQLLVDHDGSLFVDGAVDAVHAVIRSDFEIQRAGGGSARGGIRAVVVGCGAKVVVDVERVGLILLIGAAERVAMPAQLPDLDCRDFERLGLCERRKHRQGREKPTS